MFEKLPAFSISENVYIFTISDKNIYENRLRAVIISYMLHFKNIWMFKDDDDFVSDLVTRVAALLPYFLMFQQQDMHVLRA